MRIIFVRHGHPNYVDDCLTELGHKHAAAAAERLKDEGISEIFSSTCGRAYETAEYTAKKYNLPIVKCDFMREIGWGSVDNNPLPLDGHPWNTAEDMITKNEALMNLNWDTEEPFCRNQAVQYVEKIAKATDEWLETLGYSREGNYYRVTGKADTNRTIAAFGHGGASASIFHHLFGIPFPFICTAMGINYTGITVVTLGDEAGSLVMPRFEVFNDARHIAGLQITNVFDN